MIIDESQLADRSVPSLKRMLLLTFLLGFFTTLVVMPGSIPMLTDSTSRLANAHWIWSGESPNGSIPGRDGVMHWHHGLGQSFVLMPVDWLVYTLLPKIDGAHQTSMFIFYLFFPWVNGLTTALAYLLLTEIGFGARPSLLGTLTLLFASTFLWHCQNNQENPMILALSFGAIYCLLRWIREQKAKFLFGFSLLAGYSLIVRLTNIAFLVSAMCFPIIYYWLKRRSRKLCWASIAAFLRRFSLVGLPVVLAFILADRLIQYWRFGTFWTTYMQLLGDKLKQAYPTLPVEFPFENPLWEGLVGPFLAPGNSLFLYDPILILTGLLVAFHWRRLNPLVQALLLSSSLHLFMLLLGYGRFYNWSGASAWGNRFLSTPIHLFILLTIPLILKEEALVRRTIVRWGMMLVLGASILCQSSSLIYPVYCEQMQADEDPDQLRVLLRQNSLKPYPEAWFTQANGFFLGMRMRNIAAQMTGSFQKWGLDRTRAGKEFVLHPPTLVPFEPFQSLPRGMRLAIKILWSMVLVALLITCWISLRETVQRPSHSLGGRPCSN